MTAFMEMLTETKGTSHIVTNGGNMDRTEELYSFINTYTEEHELPNARIALRAARELMEGIVRTSGDFDKDGVLQQSFFEHCLFVTKLLIDLYIPLSHEEQDILVAAGLCHDTIAHAGFQRGGRELIEDYGLDPRVRDIVRITTKINVKNETDLRNFYKEIRFNKLAVLVAMADRSNLVENVYALSVNEALEYIREIRDYAMPMCVYALEHYPDIQRPMRLIVDKIHNLIDVTDIISRRYKDKENELKKELLALREENAQLRGMIASL